MSCESEEQGNKVLKMGRMKLSNKDSDVGRWRVWWFVVPIPSRGWDTCLMSDLGISASCLS